MTPRPDSITKTDSTRTTVAKGKTRKSKKSKTTKGHRDTTILEREEVRRLVAVVERYIAGDSPKANSAVDATNTKT